MSAPFVRHHAMEDRSSLVEIADASRDTSAGSRIRSVAHNNELAVVVGSSSARNATAAELSAAALSAANTEWPATGTCGLVEPLP
jgi:hypothetical protein